MRDTHQAGPDPSPEWDGPAPSLTINEMRSRAVERAKREVLAEVEAGRAPVVHDFAGLHDYFDANELGGLCEEGLRDELWQAFGREVQELVHEWLMCGGAEPDVCLDGGLCWCGGPLTGEDCRHPTEADEA